ncbi:hypothetical protein B0O99DRAFT_604909 [Bisporella sp. PMI_857]|nr:hypothetical protein B0O99DRAFT_604909 [Bisporella sp. PMI_857]
MVKIEVPVVRQQSITSGTLLVLILLGVFYYTFWNTIVPLSRYTDSPTLSITPTCPPPPSPFDPRKLAFLVETRPLPHLPALFSHMVATIPPEWTFKFMGSPSAIKHMRSSPRIRDLESTSKLSIVPLPTNYTLTSRETISQMFTDPHLYTHHLLPAEHLLVFQPDSIFCTNAPRTLNDYLSYDWVGAPWSKDSQWGGNGGLSLRNVKSILKVLEKERRKDGDGALEDLWLSQKLRALKGSNMANATVSKSFSVESVWDEAPLGYHVGWLGVHHEQIWDDERQVEHIFEYCPEVKMILGMKLDNDKPKSVAKIDGEV